MKYTCHSGGCPGADITWETVGYEYGVTTIAYSFRGHVQQSKNQKILTLDELYEGYNHVLIANRTLKKINGILPPYMRNLLSRNWYQILNSESIFAAGMIESQSTVNGGTGWAIQMAIDNKKPIYIFDQNTNKWHTYDYNMSMFIPYGSIPVLTENFAGIGTRQISDDGMNAILDVFKHNFTTLAEPSARTNVS